MNKNEQQIMEHYVKQIRTLDGSDVLQPIGENKKDSLNEAKSPDPEKVKELGEKFLKFAQQMGLKVKGDMNRADKKLYDINGKLDGMDLHVRVELY